MKRSAVIIGIILATLLGGCGGRKDSAGNDPGGETVIVTAEISFVTGIPVGTPDETGADHTGPAEPVDATEAPANDTSKPSPAEKPDDTAGPTVPEEVSPPIDPSTAPPTAAATPSITRTPAPTATLTPKPTATPTSAPTSTPAPTASPTPTAPPDYSYIERAVSPVDFNGNGIDDYTDFLNGAKKDAANHPRYDASYQANGYPPDDIGVCSDVIWRTFREAGYCLRYMVDKDIRDNTWRYPQIYNKKEKRDDKIDFRRVRNLRIFFDEYAIALTTDIYDIEEWQPGDIVIFNKNTHIGIVSDKRNEKGIPYIIHNGGQLEREQDYLEGDHTVTAHFRFDASRVPEEMLIPWEGN